ncbi:hypothetical protein LSTR_LSTR004446 [Laodelphax striatellus]|uniref:Uncharacterized protein n=1 Tax=Laodelphax striatellus TaxID=195883 RepID=A0A482XA14_LAOST|nr:hypothetical protein LSTR_LSTR004446 [Laodelphax striatellus]
MESMSSYSSSTNNNSSSSSTTVTSTNNNNNNPVTAPCNIHRFPSTSATYRRPNSSLLRYSYLNNNNNNNLTTSPLLTASNCSPRRTNSVNNNNGEATTSSSSTLSNGATNNNRLKQNRKCQSFRTNGLPSYHSGRNSVLGISDCVQSPPRSASSRSSPAPNSVWSPTLGYFVPVPLPFYCYKSKSTYR